jgi:hypothetical protein
MNKKGRKVSPFLFKKGRKKRIFNEAFKQVINNGILAERRTTTRCGVYLS